MIPFRTQRIATSVVNRILNVADGLQPVAQPGELAAPDPLPAANELEARLNAPKAPVDAPPAVAEDIALTSLTD